MSRANDNAFPIPGLENFSQFNGLSVREHFAAMAPPVPQPWFTPAMDTKRPSVPNIYGIDDDAVREDVRVADDCGTDPVTGEGIAFVEHRAEMRDKRDQWDRDYERARCVQWPAAWADAVISELAKPKRPTQVDGLIAATRALVEQLRGSANFEAHPYEALMKAVALVEEHLP